MRFIEELIFLLVMYASSRCHASVILQDSIMGIVPGENYTYYSLAQTGSVTIILYTHQGDADLYVSEGNSKPSYELDNHDLQSTTCGLDILQVPRVFKRPISIGVYGHPRYDLSLFELQIIIDDSEEPEFINYSYESDILNTEEEPETKPSYPKSDPINDQESFLWTILFSVLKVVFDILVD